MFNNRRILITGHTGFKGSWLSQWLLDLGAKIAGFSLDIPSDPSLFLTLDLASQMEDMRGDIRSFDAISRACQDFCPEIVFHLAAQPLVSAGYEAPKETFDTNVGGTVNLLEALREENIPVVIVTSDKCYQNENKGVRFRESDPLGGSCPYSASKACAEFVAKAYSRSFSQSIATVRGGNVIGGGDWGKNRLIPDCVRAWEKGEPVTLRYPDATRPWQHVLDCLSGYLWVGVHLLKRDPAVMGEAFNFGPVTESSLLVREIVDRLGNSWTSEPQPRKEAHHLSIDPSKALTRLPWAPLLSTDEALSLTMEWYKAYSRGENMREKTLEQIECLKKPLFTASI